MHIKKKLRTLWLLLYGSLSWFIQVCSPVQHESTVETFRVNGRFLMDPCGDTVILKGVNKMSVWDEDDPYGTIYFPEIAKTGANCVRIVWRTMYDTIRPTRIGHLDTLIRNCIAQQMIPMVELHDATCDLSKLPQVVDYWTQNEVVQLVKKYENALLVNIANEAGADDDAILAGHFVQAYSDAISRMRNAGIRTPLVIDGAKCGKDLEMIVATAPQLISHDLQHNVLFSVHPYWSNTAIEQFATPSFIKDQLQNAVSNNVPLIVGELCAYGGWPGEDEPDTASCSPKGAVDYQTLLAESQQHKIGWLLWEWGPGNGYFDYNPPVMCPGMDITTDGTYNSILAIAPGAPNEWAKEAVISSPYSIQHTAVKTSYLLNGFRCQ